MTIWSIPNNKVDSNLLLKLYVCGIKKKLGLFYYLKMTTVLTIQVFDWILYEWMETFVAAIFHIVRIIFIIVFCLKLALSVFYIPLATTRTKVFRWHDMEKLIESIHSSTFRKVGSLYLAIDFFPLESLIQIYKSIIRLWVVYCCHICSCASAMYLVIPDKIQRKLCNDIGLDLAYRFQSYSPLRNVASRCFFYPFLFWYS